MKQTAQIFSESESPTLIIEKNELCKNCLKNNQN